MNNLTKYILVGLVIIFAFILQMYVNTNITFLGAKANIILTLIIWISMWFKPNISIPYVVTIGFLSDILFTFTLGKYLISYSIIVLVIILFSKVYNKQGIFSILLVVLAATFIHEAILGIIDFIQFGNFKSILYFLKIVLGGGILNVAIYLIFGYILKPLKICEE